MARELMEFADLIIREEDLRDTPPVSFDQAAITDGIPEKWEWLLRHNEQARKIWEADYGDLSRQAFALMGIAGWCCLSKEEAAQLHVAFYSRHGRREDGIRKASYALKAWVEGYARAEAWEAGVANGRSSEREPGEPLPGELGPHPLSGDTSPSKPQMKGKGPVPAPLVIRATDFLKRPRGEQAKLIPRLGGRRGGKLGLYGPGGSGKSYTFLNIAVAGANGDSLLEHPEWSVANPLHVAFISLEDPASEQLDRLSRLLGPSEPPPHLFIFDRDLEEDGFVLASGRRGDLNERAFRRLDSCLGDLKIDLLLIEPKRYLVDVDENSSTENMPWQRRLQDLLIRHGTLAVVGHHAGWEKDGKIHARGTTVFRDWVDGMIQQTEDQIQGKPGFLLTCNKSNFAARWNPLSVLFDPETGKMQAVDETTGKIPPSLLRACFEEHGGAIEAPVRDVYEILSQYANCSEATARRAIEGAIKDGWLQVRGRGKGYGLYAHGGSNA